MCSPPTLRSATAIQYAISTSRGVLSDGLCHSGRDDTVQGPDPGRNKQLSQVHDEHRAVGQESKDEATGTTWPEESKVHLVHRLDSGRRVSWSQVIPHPIARHRQGIRTSRGIEERACMAGNKEGWGKLLPLGLGTWKEGGVWSGCRHDDGMWLGGKWDVLQPTSSFHVRISWVYCEECR